MMWYAAIILGLGGGLHCLGMCSPLAMAVTASAKSPILSRLIYNGGRIVTYALLGALVSGFGTMLKLSDFQKEFSVLAGIILICIGLFGVTSIRVPLVSHSLQWLSIRLKSAFSKFLLVRNLRATWLMGMLNGLLPCGLTYIALAYCISLHVVDGFIYMLAFGISTLPVMLGSGYIAGVFHRRFNLNFRKMTTAIWIFLGILLAARGLTPFHMDQHQGEQEITICR